MANWTGFIMTNKGAELQAKVNAGTTNLTLTKMALGSGQAAGAVEGMTELANKVMDMTIKSVETKGNIVTLRSTITNVGVTAAFYAREMGIYATDPDEGEILYAVQTDPEPDNIPAEGSATVVSEDFTANLIMSNTGNVSATLDPHALMTLEDLEKHNADEAAHEAAFTLHNGKEDAHAAAFAKHNEDATAHAAAIAVHNTDGSAHSDIRQLVTKMRRPTPRQSPSITQMEARIVTSASWSRHTIPIHPPIPISTGLSLCPPHPMDSTSGRVMRVQTRFLTSSTLFRPR